MLSSAEVTYTLQGIEQDLREDGRSRLDYRCITVEVGIFPQASGSARLQLGATDVLVGVVAELSEPDEATPDSGRILISVDAGPGDMSTQLPSYDGCDSERPADGALLWLQTALTPLYSATSIPETLRALCIMSGVQCWQLRVHAQLLRCDGCPLDALNLAINAALHNTRVPKMAISISGASAGKSGGSGSAQQQLDLDLDESLDESLSLDCALLPVYVTLSSLGAHCVADCTRAERSAAGSSCSLALNTRGEVCAMRAGGGCGINLVPLGHMQQTARYLGAALLAIAQAAISQAVHAAEQRGFPHADGGALGILECV
tara:strand:+ start:246 stop:1199 length:954 start_codon:yes stop_codon:yes gene_type:complete